MKKIILSFILFVCFESVVSAQATGYMGKKFGIYYQPYIGLGSNTWNKTVTTFNLRNSIALDYAVARSISLGGSFQFLKTAVDDNYLLVTDAGVLSDPEDDKELLFNGDIVLNVFFYSVYAKFFDYKHAGAIAPNGRYHKIEFAYFYLNYETKTESVVNYKYESLPRIEDAGFTKPTPTIAILYTYGKQFILADKILFTSGGQLGFSMKIANELDEKEFPETGYEKLFQERLNGRIAGAIALNFQIGIGLLQ